MAKKIAILGRGHVGGALSRGLSRAGHDVIAQDRDHGRALLGRAEFVTRFAQLFERRVLRREQGIRSRSIEHLRQPGLAEHVRNGGQPVGV